MHMGRSHFHTRLTCPQSPLFIFPGLGKVILFLMTNSIGLLGRMKIWSIRRTDYGNYLLDYTNIPMPWHLSPHWTRQICRQLPQVCRHRPLHQWMIPRVAFRKTSVTPRGTHQIGCMAPCFLNPSLTLNYLQTGAKLDFSVWYFCASQLGNRYKRTFMLCGGGISVVGRIFKLQCT